MKRTSCLLLLALALSCSACLSSLTIASAVTMPARAPVFVFPTVLVAGGKYEEEVYLLDRIAAHLARDKRREVRRVQADELEPARQAGQISWLTAVVQLSLSLRSSERLYTTMAATPYCGPYGCGYGMYGYGMYGAYNTYVPVLRGEVVLTVHEGPTARVLSRETFSDFAEGDALQALRPELIERLAQQLEEGVDLHLERMTFVLGQTKIKAVDDGIALLSLGKYKEGRAALEGAAKALGGEKKETQARVLHALGVSRVLSPTPGSMDLADALRALRLAAQVDPHKRYLDTLSRVEKLAKQTQVVVAQQQAAAHNFQLADEAKQVVPGTAPAPTAPAPSSPDAK
jgi:hypothetical protein